MFSRFMHQSLFERLFHVCVSLTLAGPCPRLWLWVPTSSATRFRGWHLASGPSARAAQTPSLLWAKAPKWASMSASTSSGMDAGTVRRSERGRSSVRSFEQVSLSSFTAGKRAQCVCVCVHACIGLTIWSADIYFYRGIKVWGHLASFLRKLIIFFRSGINLDL